MDIREVIKIRKSCRSYNGKPLERDTIDMLKEYAEGLESPFGNIVRIHFLEAEAGQKMGTYGVIKGADTYIGVTVTDGLRAMADLGYVFEKVVLKATENGLGTCWLAGTFNRKQFKNAVKPEKGELFPVVSPIGFPAEKSHGIDKLLRKGAGSDKRKPYEELFFDGDFSTSLKEKSEALEMARLAPSASNRQPWRVVKCGEEYHFYKAGKNLSDKSLDLDVGIAACHFDMVSGGGYFTVHEPDILKSENTEYLFTWVKSKE